MTKLIISCAMLLVACISADAQIHPTTAPTSQPAVSDASHDHFIGWYRLPSRTESLKVNENAPGTYIPVFKRNGTFYTVCRFAEVPLKVVDDGLEWDLRPSSMVGTKITFDAQKQEYALVKHDSAAQGVSEDLNGMVQPMRKVPAPFESLETEAKAPQSNDDFVGWYEAVWMRPLRYHIRKDGDKFVMEGQIVGRPGGNEPAFELMPLADSLGFTMGSRGKTSFVYNEKLKRYEVGGAGSPVGIPMRRSETEPSKDLPRYPDVAGLGIPSWH